MVSSLEVLVLVRREVEPSYSEGGVGGYIPPVGGVVVGKITMKRW